VVWDAERRRDQSGSVPLEVPIGGGTDLVRIRLSAEGVGPPGRWHNARIIHRGPVRAVAEDVEIPAPPRLVVLYVMDALRADHVGRRGDRDPLTPVLDGLAAGGVRFENHFAVAPNTAPSTRALFSGLCMLDDRRLADPGPIRLAEVFRSAGYHTASFTGNPNLGPALDLAAGFDTVELLRVPEDHHPHHPPTVNRSAELLHRAALSWLDELGAGDRGFLYVHTLNPHNPYTPPPEIEVRLAPPERSHIDGRTRTLVAIRDREREVSTGDMDRIRELYAAGVAYNDRELGRFLDNVSRRFAPGEVLVIVTSDHGEELFEHGGVLHGYTLYDEMLRIPLIVSWPDLVGPGRVVTPTTTLDLHASLIGLLGRSLDTSTGRSLWPEILGAGGRDIGRRLIFAAAPGLDGAVMARSSEWKLIHAPRDGIGRGQGHGRGRSRDLEYVFNLRSDPVEHRNLAGVDNLEVAWLRTRLAGWLEIQRSLQPEPDDREMDTATSEQLEALGYVVN
jgi:arylsulfatase A-like enzyme